MSAPLVNSVALQQEKQAGASSSPQGPADSLDQKEDRGRPGTCSVSSVKSPLRPCCLTATSVRMFTPRQAQQCFVSRIGPAFSSDLDSSLFIRGAGDPSALHSCLFPVDPSLN